MLSVEKIVNSLGGRAILGHRLLSGSDLVDLVHKGLPSASASFVLKNGVLSKAEFYKLIASDRTFARRLHEKKLSSTESDKLTRFIRVRAFAADVFGDEKEADLWLREKNLLLNNNRPLDMLDTDSGSQLVENILGRIAHGIPS
ncbi:MAG TPA: antitoxin Xre/MbcA/ParS toxin-binding domain-containing protein [Alphaproteobacteria bacterium]|nr:antitoxin Xre/MbcA/ParS toxin-binding domain-containing protein [Alphaproteobacteria bacterium]